MKEQNGKLSRDEFLSFVKAVLKKKSLEENKPLYFEYRLSENGEKEKESIRNLSPTLKENAINIVVERIVKIHGNS